MTLRKTPLALALTLASPLCLSVHAAEQEFTPMVVTATRQAQRANELLANVDVIERAEIEQAGSSSLPELLARQAGVQMVSNGGAGKTASLFIRGTSQKQTVILIDGMRVGSATAGGASLENIPLAQIERIEILRGPASALYGADAIGGVIQIFTRQGSGAPKVTAYAGFGTQGTEDVQAGVSGSSGAFSYSLRAGHYDTAGFNLSNTRNFNFNPDRDGYRNVNAGGQFGYQWAAGQKLSLSLLSAEGRNWYDASKTNPTDGNNFRLTSVGLTSTNQLATGWLSTLRVGETVDRQSYFGTARDVFETTQQQVSWQHDVRLPVGSLMFAIEQLDQKISSTQRYDVTSRRIDSALLGWGAALGQHQIQVNVRHDRNSQFGDKNTGMLAYGYRFSPQLKLHASVGTAFKAPTFNDLYYPNTGYGGGNASLRPEEARNREIGLNWSTGMGLLTATYFHNKITDLIAGWPPVNINKADIKGVELGWRGEFAGWLAETHVDLMRGRDEDTGLRLQRRADRQATARLSRDIGSWRTGVEWLASADRFDDTANKNRLGGYAIANLFAHYRLTPEWTLEARANNVFNREYETARGYVMPRAQAFIGMRYTPR